MATTCLAKLTSEQQQAYQQLLNSQNSCSSSFLAEALELPDYKHDARSSIIVDYVAWMSTLCHELQLDSRQTMAVLRIGQQLLEGCSLSVPRLEAQDLLKSSLLQLCVPTISTAVVSDTSEAAASGADATAILAPVQLLPDAVVSLAAAFTSTLLQHYTLWTYVFTKQQQHVQHQHHLMVESPVAPPPLQQALIEADWQAHLVAEMAQREAQAAAAEAAERAAHEAEAAAAVAAAEAAETAARAEQLQRKPKTLDEAVDKLVALRLEDVRQALAVEYAGKATALSGRISQLEQQLQQQAAQPPAVVQSQGGSHGGKSSSRVASAKPPPS